MTQIRRFDPAILVAALLLMIAACGGGGGCGGCGMEPTPGGFPAAERNPNAAQLRVSPTALAKITADPAGVIAPLVGSATNGVIDFDIPASCTGNPQICCVNGQPAASCGPLQIDLVARTGDPARLALVPVQDASRLDLTLRARVKTAMKLPIRYDTGLVGVISCDVEVDTTRGSNPDLTISAQIAFTQDPTVSTTRIEANNVSVTGLQSADVTLSGNFSCTLASALVGSLIGTLQTQLGDQLRDQINTATCKSCDAGDVATCGSSFATACTDGTCMVADRCLQELGLSGRARGTSVFASLSPGTTGALDLYEVAGGYATPNNGGIALGVLGGMAPGGVARDRCGPPAAGPATPTITPSAFFQGNVRPDTSAPFDVAIGVHASQLGEFAWAGYDGGLLCLTIGSAVSQQLSTDTFALLSRSLGKLVESNAPMAIGLRPQSPPTITLGRNTFTDDGQGNRTLTEPLLDLRFAGLELDFFASIDDQWVRVFTVVSDVHLPIGLETAGMNEIVPVLGSVENAFTNLSVKNSEAVTESPADLANLFPNLLNLVLPQLTGGLGGFALPALGGLELAVTDITSIEDNAYLAIFANLVTAMPARAVETSVTLAGVAEPAAEVARTPARWRAASPPVITLDLGRTPGLEFQHRIDEGAWSPWQTNRRPALTSQVFWLPGQHTIETRARAIGRPGTIDHSPAVIQLVLGTDVDVGGPRVAASTNNGFHGTAGAEGCGCRATSSPGNPAGAAPLALVLLALLAPLRRIRRALRAAWGNLRGAVRAAWGHARRLGLVVWASAAALLPGCSCGSDNPCGAAACLAGELSPGGLGRFTSITGDADRVLVATYDQGFGDLVIADATDPAAVVLTVVDGVPDVTPIYEPSTYRGGIEDAGPNVGAWTSIAVSDKLAKVAYQDRDARALKYAYEATRGQWNSYVLDATAGVATAGVDVGSHAAIAIDGGGRPVVAYLAVGTDDGQGHRVTELRLQRSAVKQPASDADWSSSVVARAPGTCAGLCGAGTACIAGTPEICSSVTADCASACGDGEVCIAGGCTEELAAPTTATLATGTGLFVNLVALPDGRLVAVYYDRSARALVLAAETAPDASTFTAVTLDSVTPGDRGMWASAAVDGAGVVHIAYQDAIGDQLFYTTWNGTPGTPELVDDGQRTGDRTHPVGAAAALYIVSGGPVIAYQDGLTSDVYLAAKAGAGWTTELVAGGPLLDGISIAATTGHGTPYLAWDSLDPAVSPINQLRVITR